MTDIEIEPKPKISKHGILLETEAHNEGVVVRCGLDPASHRRQSGDFGYGILMPPTEAVAFALAILHAAWKVVKGRIHPVVQIGLKMGWIEEKGISND